MNFFLKEILWTESTRLWTKGTGPVHGSTVDRLHTPSPASNPGPLIRIQRLEEEEAGQQKPQAAQPPESHRNCAPVAGGSP
jgi:hypothetical protein